MAPSETDADTGVTDSEESRAYLRHHRLASLVLSDVSRRLTDAVGALGDPYLTRAKLAEPRIKSLASLARKARERKWTVVEAIRKAQDFVGLRLVCNNLQDSRRVADLLEGTLKGSGLEARRDDSSRRVRPSGYRAIHLVFRVPVRVGKDDAQIGCEVQIRSLLQDSWAELSRADVYAGSLAVSKPIEARMLNLSKLLARADEMADRIRVDLVRPRRGRRPPAGQQLSASSLAFVFKRKFGQDPPDYVIQSVLREVEGSQIAPTG
jgi:ppGpp synthetase/RelA/SpoT-type nucleotidyltranferase